MNRKIKKSIRRDWLKRQIEAGKIEVKCNYHMTDDYAFDNANDFGKTDWMPARMRHPKYEQRKNYVGNTVDVCTDDDFVDGYMNLNEYEFTGKSGGAYQYEDGTIHFYVHSNLSYDMRLVERKPAITQPINRFEGFYLDQ